MTYNTKYEISKTRTKLSTIQNNLIELYLKQIGESYKVLDPSNKQPIIEKLEVLCSEIEENRPALETSTGIKIHTIRKNIAFDGKKAKEVRIKKKLSREQLVRKLGLKNHLKGMISKYETEALRPSNPPRGVVSKKYIPWLKKQGYNPFNL